MFNPRVLVGTALAVIALYTATPASAGTLTVASWNLNNFAGQNGSGCNPRTQDDYDAIKTIVTNTDADVWLFQEVDSAGALARILDPAVWSFITENREWPGSQGKCDDGIRYRLMQRPVTAVKRKWQLGRSGDLAFLDVGGKGTLRHGVAVTVAFEGQRIEIINLHLKSGCAEGSEAAACSTLFQQIPYLASYLDEATTRGSLLLVGGDFNRRLSAPNDDAFATITYGAASDIQISSIKGSSKCNLNGKEPIDYFLTNKHMRNYFPTSIAYEKPFTGPFKSWPSDHCPIVTSFSTSK